MRNKFVQGVAPQPWSTPTRPNSVLCPSRIFLFFILKIVFKLILKTKKSIETSKRIYSQHQFFVTTTRFVRKLVASKKLLVQSTRVDCSEGMLNQIHVNSTTEAAHSSGLFLKNYIDYVEDFPGEIFQAALTNTVFFHF